MDIPKIRIEQTWQGKNLHIQIVFSFELEERMYAQQHTIKNTKDGFFAYESEVAFVLARMFRNIYEDISHDNAEKIK